MDANNVVKELIEGDAKNIRAVLPDIIRILEEGDTTTRISNLLIANGWTGMDAWREFKTVPLGGHITTNIINDLMGVDKGIGVYNRFNDEARSLKSFLRRRKQ